MKTARRLSFLLALIITLSCCLPLTFTAVADDEVADNPGIISGNAVVAYARDEDRFLYTYRLDERVAPAVATKLMTCMVVADILEEFKQKPENVKVLVTQEAINLRGKMGDPRIPQYGYQVNDQDSAQEMLGATLVASANDAAAALAVHFGTVYLKGNVNTFVERMNKKAEELGLENTHFTNPTGLDDPNQYSTPREIALIASAFYGYNNLFTLSDQEKLGSVANKNALNSDGFMSGYKNINAKGMIAGQLDADGNYCLITATENDGKAYIFVVMCATGIQLLYEEEGRNPKKYFDVGNAYDDMNKLIDWTRNSFELVSIASETTIIGELQVDLGNSTDHAMVYPAEAVESLLLKSEKKSIKAVLVYDDSIVYKKEFNGQEYDTVMAPVEAGQQVGEIVYTCNGTELARVPAIIKEGIPLDKVKNFFSKTEDFLFGPVMKVVIIVVVSAIGIYLIAAIVSLVVSAKNKKAKSAKTKKSSGTKALAKPDTKQKNNSASNEKPKDNKSDTKEMR